MNILHNSLFCSWDEIAGQLSISIIGRIKCLQFVGLY